MPDFIQIIDSHVQQHSLLYPQENNNIIYIT